MAFARFIDELSYLSRSCANYRSKSFPECVTCESNHRSTASESFALFKVYGVQADHLAAGDLIGLGCDVHHFEPVSVLVRERAISTSQELTQSIGLKIEPR